MEDMRHHDLLSRIRELEFAAVDLNLYLDNHPACQQALIDYNTITSELIRLKEIYESECGPLTNFGYCPSQYPWRWVNEPWPWECGE